MGEFYPRIGVHLENILSSTSSPTIVLISTKTDDDCDILPENVRDRILSHSRSLIKKVTGYNSGIRKVFLVNDVYHTSSGLIPREGDIRKSPRELQTILASLNSFNAKREFLIPQNWSKFGKFMIVDISL